MIHGLNWVCMKHPRVVLYIAMLVAGIGLFASPKADSFVHRHADRKLSEFAETIWPWVTC
ncbi:hypothetical protein LMG28614_06612 [Paraburkholderia ultramafica]|uniref:Uncharacterized protein n=1 Tax=Paraburkholderia ultramafica TaxID=1544867 RepID=A0A6S7BNV1_9BURK|nr:hypothetical protein [Paraburkholderia ultramafica]CAB3807487.1 hypothetical protein LMG28614_06612 [Paraburkholderia ultramafica]